MPEIKFAFYLPIDAAIARARHVRFTWAVGSQQANIALRWIKIEPLAPWLTLAISKTIFGIRDIVMDQVVGIMTISWLKTSIKRAICTTGVAIGANCSIKVIAIGVEKAAGLSTVRSKPCKVFTFDVFSALIATFFDT